MNPEFGPPSDSAPIVPGTGAQRQGTPRSAVPRRETKNGPDFRAVFLADCHAGAEDLSVSPPRMSESTGLCGTRRRGVPGSASLDPCDTQSRSLASTDLSTRCSRRGIRCSRRCESRQDAAAWCRPCDRPRNSTRAGGAPSDTPHIRRCSRSSCPPRGTWCTAVPLPRAGRGRSPRPRER
jgi:hypothetical protein